LFFLLVIIIFEEVVCCIGREFVMLLLGYAITLLLMFIYPL
jgi:hypothetical protein